MSHNAMTTAEQNLHQAAEVETASAWTVARLIAASVEQAKRGPKSSMPQGMKLGTNAAAKAMGRSVHTILAYLTAWNAAAEDGLCAPSSDLTPDDGWTASMPDAAEWEKYKQGNSHSTPRKVETIPEPVEAARTMTTQQKQEFISDAIKSSPEIATAADQALEDRSKEQVFRPSEPKAETPAQEDQRGIQAAMKARKIHREMVDLITIASNLPDAMNSAIAAEMDWLINAAGVVREACSDSRSMDEQLAELLDAEAGR